MARSGIPGWILVVIACLTAAGSVSARVPDEGSTVHNVRFEQSSSSIFIKYDLMGEKAAEYTVRMYLQKEGDPTFLHVPASVSGDIGEGVTPGKDKRIAWFFAGEFPMGLDNPDYYFVVEAELKKPKRGPWLWVGGAAVAAGGALWLLLPRPAEAGPTSSQGFPSPPGRP